jgi:hypothetical protein
MAYDPRVINAILRIAKRRGESQEAVLGALATGIVESGLQELSGGDADSYGWRQQRESIYGRQGLSQSINNFFDEWAQHDTPGFNPGVTSANVQRPAEQYRGRYAEVMDEARKLLGGDYKGGGGGGQPAPAAQAQGSNLFQTLANLNRATVDLTDPVWATQQQGWDLLAQLAGQQGTPLNTSLGTQPRQAPSRPNGEINELFYDPLGGYDEGKNIGAIGGHGSHVHVGADPSLLNVIARRAQKRGLSVREYEPYDPVDPVHTEGSLHYSGRAADISGDPNDMGWLFRWIRRRYM